MSEGPRTADPRAAAGARRPLVRRAARSAMLRLPIWMRPALVRAGKRVHVPRRLHLPRRIKVSVIVAAYNSEPSGLERMMKSLDAQTMSPRAIEIVFVDDGSTDDTHRRLETIAKSRPNVVVRSIPNSGWASRPRNVGIGLARGEYLLFMDHDDELFPRGLERAYEYGRQHHADVVNAKEVRTKGWSWGWDSFTRDVPNAEYVDPNPLIPMTPHKLYRRQFVLDNQLRFPEGSRVLWEDIYFNTAAYACGARVSVLSEQPFYHWVNVEQNTSKTFARDPDEFWANLAKVLAFISSELADHPGRDQLVMHHVRARVLSFLGPGSLRRPVGYYDVAYRHIRQIVADYAPVHLDAELPAVHRSRIELVRVGDSALQRRLAEQDDGITAVPTAETIRWEGRELVLEVTTTLVDKQGAPVRVSREDERWVRWLPDELAQSLSAEALDVTAEIARATFEVSVKGRASRSAWPLPTTSSVSCRDDARGYGIITATATARFDPVAFAAAHDLDDPVWDFAARLDVMGYVSHRGIRAGATTVALLDGTPAIGYVNRDGIYSLDVAAAVRSVTGSAPLDPEQVTVSAVPDGNGVRVTVTATLPAVHCAGRTRLRGKVLIGSKVRAPAVLQDEDGQAVLRFTAVVPPGEHPLRTRFLGRTGDTSLVMSSTGSTARVVAAKALKTAARVSDKQDLDGPTSGAS
ncbi:MAG: glycosyltransferase family 2 protein [Actinomycetota bacterium]|nr:glycosyltransferase family 2 protein [Actinomycetota bacterium]